MKGGVRAREKRGIINLTFTSVNVGKDGTINEVWAFD